MKVLVTGGAGFIGCHVCRMLLDRGHTVVSVDDMRGDDGLSERRMDFAAEENPYGITFVEGDAASSSVLSDVKSGKFDAIVHLAAEPGVRRSIRHPSWFMQANVDPAVRILEALREGDGSGTRFVYASSSSVYGNSPYDSIMGGGWSAACRKRPLSPYAVSKSALEDMCLYYRRSHSIDAVGVRPFTVFGRFQRKDLAVKAWAEDISSGRPAKVYEQGGGTPTLEKRRDMTHVDDVARMFCLLCEESYEREVSIFNAGQGHPVSMGRVLEKLNRLLGGDGSVERVYVDAQEYEPEETFADTTFALFKVGWSANIGTFEGIERMLREENYL